MHIMEERQRDFIAYIYLSRYLYYQPVQTPYRIEKACVIKRTFMSQLVFFRFQCISYILDRSSFY